MPFYAFPSSQIWIIGALGIALAIEVFYVAYKKYFNSNLNKELAENKTILIKEKRIKWKIRKNRTGLKNL